MTTHTCTTTVAVTPDTLPPAFTRADLDKYDTILFDLDGCVWDQYHFYAFSKETLETLTKMGKRLIFCSNNAVAYHGDLMGYFEKNGFPITFPAHYHLHRKNKATAAEELSASDPATSTTCTLTSDAAPAHAPPPPPPDEADLVPQQLYTSALATAAWCERWFAAQGYDASSSSASNDKVLFCGEKGFYREMLGHGFAATNVIDVIDLAGGINDISGLLSYAVDPSVKCVVVGFNRSYSYIQAAILTQYLHELHIPLISTNPDMSFSLPGGRILPEFGGFVLQLEAAAGIKALVTCGKPGAAMFEQIKDDVAEYCSAKQQKEDKSEPQNQHNNKEEGKQQHQISGAQPSQAHGFTTTSTQPTLQQTLNTCTHNSSSSSIAPMERSRTLMIGDNILTDIQFGKNAGIDTLLVLSGVTQSAYVPKRCLPQQPTAAASSSASSSSPTEETSEVCETATNSSSPSSPCCPSSSAAASLSSAPQHVEEKGKAYTLSGPKRSRADSATTATDGALLEVNKSPSAVHTLINKYQIVPTYVAPNIGALIGL